MTDQTTPKPGQKIKLFTNNGLKFSGTVKEVGTLFILIKDEYTGQDRLIALNAISNIEGDQ